MRDTPGVLAVAGVDGSSQSREALTRAVEEAGLRGGRVIAVTAWDFPLMVNGPRSRLYGTGGLRQSGHPGARPCRRRALAA
ncbi:universal stress protein [Sinomonas sp.]|uniref:universal stress protein n=1 Tax=Sinomonas sp. TaxID=1914986 RepID=UPI003F7F0C70